MRVVLTGGGTGGHIYPALSVAQLLEGDELLYVGTGDGPEARIVPDARVPFRSIPSRKLSRKPSLSSVAALAVSAYGVFRGAALLRQWRPDVVLGTGGYASAGVMFAAALLRIPTVIHEANAIPGRVNQLLGRLCTRVAVTYDATRPYFPAAKTVVTGMPVRPDLMQADPGKAHAAHRLDPSRPVVLVSGGSGGAQTLNAAVVEALPLLDDGANRVQVVHQTGRTHYDEVIRRAGELPAWYRPLAYVDDMPALLAAADLVVCRGGSSTLAEVTALGKPAVVVPYPYAVADHQRHNARALAESGAAVLVEDRELTGERLRVEIETLLGDQARLERMREASRRLGRPDAARQVADLLRHVARRPSRRGTELSRQGVES